MKLLKIILLSAFILVTSFQSFGQYGFQKVYDHEVIDTFSIISDIYVQDSIPYLTLGSGRGMARMDFRFGSVNEDGDYENIIQYNDSGHLQRSMFSNVDTDTNFRGNLVNCYRSTSALGNVFRLIEYDLDGQIYLDSVYSDFWTVDSIQFFDYSKLLHLNDSSYLLNLNYLNYTQSSPEYDITGTMILKINYMGEIQNILKIVNTSHPDRPSSLGRNLIKKSQDTCIVHYLEQSIYSSSNADLSWAIQKFLTIDTEGNILDVEQFQDGQHCYSLYGSYFDHDTTYLQYYDSKLFGNPPNNDYFKYMPVLSRIDENMDTVWRIQLSNFWYTAASEFSSILKIRKINDTTFISAYQHTEEIEYNLHYKNTVRILNFSSTGHINWQRDFYYYDIDLFNDPEYQINDLEIMPDGGLIMGGQVFNYDFFNDNEPSQFAYLLRTNCLGYLSPPEAALSYESDGNEVLFINNSMNAGSYTYYFGNGDSLSTDEYSDSIVYAYENAGDYEVTLITHGCNNEETDTIKFNLTISQEEETYGDIGDNFFNLYPNPVQQGNLITIETGNVENSELLFYDAQGKLVKRVPLPKAKSIYFIEHNFASSTYAVQLFRNEEVLQLRKLVVQ
ncbi:MAG: T9SS type A sorting domain-containing protein [Brumimicrobium sp.]|nr:T9SS type A sorting domain-containing protein [Brumimicrobium sp.]